LRLISCPSLLRYFLAILNIVDIVALTTEWVVLIMNVVRSRDKFQVNYVDYLSYLQVLRVLRFLRLVKNVTGCKVLTYSIRSNFKDLLVLMTYLFIGVTLFGTIVYFCEYHDSFATIPDGWWWALVTMTTVGYGDAVPKTAAGKLVGSMCAVSGVILLSVSIPTFVNTFLTLYHYATLHTKLIREGKGDTSIPT
jgi:hypothetical protein